MQRTFVLQTERAVVDGAVRPAAIIVEDGVIQGVEHPEDIPSGLPVDDVGQQVVMPGLVDAHVHVNEPGRTEWEGFDTATRAAAAGGVTTIVDMPLNSSPVTTTPEALEQKQRAAAEQLYVDCGFYGGLIPEDVDHVEALLDAGVVGVKVFLCHSGIDEFPNATEAELRAAMPLLAERDVPLLVHAELVDDQVPAVDDPRSYDQYAASRPQRFERRAIELLVELCEETGCPVHIVHLAAAEALPTLREARRRGLPLTVETCPHYLNFFTGQIPDGAPAYKCAPPIRDAANRNQLREALAAGDIDTVGSDHSPSPPSMKELDSGNVRDAWGGIASLQLLLPALWTAMRPMGATVAEVAEWTSSRPARLLGIDDRVGAVAAGQRAHLVVWDPDASFRVDAEQLFHRHPVCPYHGKELDGVVSATYLHGHKMFDGHRVDADPRGRQITR